MSFIRPEDLPKIAKLGGAVVAVFGCAAWRVVGATAPQAPAPAAAAATPETVAATATPPTEEKKDGEIEVPAMFATASVDPFRFIQAPPGSRVAQAPMAGGPIQPLPLPSYDPGARPLAPVQTAPAEVPMRVSGILPGLHATAVIEIGGNARVVHAGQRLSNGLIVSRIDALTVTLRRGRNRVVLDIAE